MSVVNLHIHHVTKVEVNTERQGDYAVQHVTVHYSDYLNHPCDLRLTLFTKDGVHEVPFEFSKNEGAEPPPALKLEIQRDLDGAVRHGKVFGEFLDSMLSPKAR